MTLCHSRSDAKCRDLKNLCAPDDAFQFDFKNEHQVSQPCLFNIQGYSIFALDSIVPNTFLIVNTEEHFKFPMHLPIRLGDYDMDGYPDLLLLTGKNDGQQVNLLRSIRCDHDKCGKEATAANRRSFELVTNGVDPLMAAGDTTVGAIFYDVDDDVC